MTKKAGDNSPGQPHQTEHAIGKKKAKKSFEKMKLNAKKRAFTSRVQVADKNTVSQYLNEEIKRHIDIFLEK